MTSPGPVSVARRARATPSSTGPCLLRVDSFLNPLSHRPAEAHNGLPSHSASASGSGGGSPSHTDDEGSSNHFARGVLRAAEKLKRAMGIGHLGQFYYEPLQVKGVDATLLVPLLVQLVFGLFAHGACPCRCQCASCTIRTRT